MKSIHSCYIAILFLVPFIFSCTTGKIGDRPSIVSTQNCWATVGSAGIVDDAARDNIFLGFPPDPNVVLPPGGEISSQTIVLDATATLNNRSPKGVYQIRYPVNQQFIFRLFSGEDDFIYEAFLEARYKVIDKAKSAVVVQLKRAPREHSSTVEQSEVILALHSDDFSESDNFHTESVFNGELLLDFTRFAYYVDVQLINKHDPPDFEVPGLAKQSVSPAIASIAICRGGGPNVDVE